jgi:RPA family protein
MLRAYCESVLSVIAVALLGCAAAAQAETVLVRSGRAECAIVVDPSASDLHRFAAQEIQRHIAAVAGAHPVIVTPAEAQSLASRQPLILVGGPVANSLVREATAAKLANFEGLKKDGSC